MLKFSVLMCVYGGDNSVHFDQALQSVYWQTLQPAEVVLVVDGPVSEQIDEVIEKYQKYSNFHVFRLRENQGHGNARRYGFSKCQYEYVAIADADDINMRERFEVQMGYFERNPALGAVSSGCIHFTDDISHVINEEKMPQSDSEIKKAMRISCPICQPSVILNKKEVIEAGGYKDWYMAEDYYLWIRMMINGASFANTPMSLLYLRTTPAQMDRRGGYKYFKSMSALYRYMLDNKLISRSIYMFNNLTRFVVQVLLPRRVRALIRKLVQ